MDPTLRVNNYLFTLRLYLGSVVLMQECKRERGRGQRRGGDGRDMMIGNGPGGRDRGR